MGKKKYKNAFDKLHPMEQEQFLREQADIYNIEGGYSRFGDVGGRFGGGSKGSYTDLGDAIAQSSYDNFSNRMALQEAALAGNKKAAALLEMDEGINQTAAVESWMEKQHGKHVGGGDYTWGSDPAAVAQHFADANRAALVAALNKGKGNSNAPVDPSDFSASREYELSPELNSAIDRNNDFIETRLAGQIFKPMFEEPTESDLIAEGIRLAEVEEAEQDNRDNPFLFDYINDMNLA
jgi:hypothetical protein